MNRKHRKTRVPRGWNEARVRKVLAYYEGQSEGEAVREDEAAFKPPSHTAVKVPRRLLPVVRRLIALSET